jgi:FkbM family methyltransferase
MKASVVMLILCRDEADIIRENLSYHLHHGVDAFVIMDNGSIDGTRDLLVEFEKLGVTTIVDQPMHIKAQGQWMTELAGMARDKYQPDWVIANDADEFWIADNGNIRTTLMHSAEGKQVGWCTVPRFNMLLSRKLLNKSGKFWQITLCAHNPYSYPSEYIGIDKPSPPDNFFSYAVGDKVICRPQGLHSINHGNHSAEHSLPSAGRMAGMHILHFPIRSYEQFIQKVKDHGSAYAANKEIPQDISWHLKRWYKLYQQGLLDEEFKRLVLSPEQERQYLHDDVLTINDELWLSSDRHELTLSPEEKRDLNRTYNWRIELVEPLWLQFSILEGQEYPPFPGLSEEINYVIDVGANIGSASVYFSDVYSNAEIHAFEPSPRNYELLLQNTQARPRIKSYPFGLWSSDATKTMQLGNSTVCDSLLISRNSTDQKIQVSLKCASDIFKNITQDQPYILKIDTEGCEVEILTELGSYLDLAKAIYFEYHCEKDRLTIQQLLIASHTLFYSSANAAHRGICGYVLNSIAESKPETSNPYHW